jgi:hypothetical protein
MILKLVGRSGGNVLFPVSRIAVLALMFETAAINL